MSTARTQAAAEGAASATPADSRAPVEVAVEQGVVSLEQESAAPLGEEVVAGHVGTPMAEHFGHVLEAHRGQFEGPKEPRTTRPGEERSLDRR